MVTDLSIAVVATLGRLQISPSIMPIQGKAVFFLVSLQPDLAEQNSLHDLLIPIPVVPSLWSETAECRLDPFAKRHFLCNSCWRLSQQYATSL